MKLTAGHHDPNDLFELIPENEVVGARLVEVVDDSFEWPRESGEIIQKLKWVFVVTDSGPWEGKEIKGQTSYSFTAHPNCKAWNWAKSLVGRDFTEGEELDTDDLVGAPCRLLIGHEKDKKDRTWMRVNNVLPPRKGGGTPPPF